MKEPTKYSWSQKKFYKILGLQRMVSHKNSTTSDVLKRMIYIRTWRS